MHRFQALMIGPAVVDAMYADRIPEAGGRAILEEVLYLADRYTWPDVLEAIGAALAQKERALADPLDVPPGAEF